MIRFLTLCLLTVPLALVACAAPLNVVRRPDGKLITPDENEAASYCARDGLRARIIGLAPGNTQMLFECVKN